MVSPPPVNSSFDAIPPNINPVALQKNPLDLIKALRPTAIWVRWFNQILTALTGTMNYSASTVQSVTTGFSITLAGTIKILTLTPSAPIASGTIIMPSGAYDGQPVQVSTTQAITALTVQPNAGQTVLNAPTTLAAGASFMYYYNLTNNTWYRLI
jgi:hypothetical protein